MEEIGTAAVSHDKWTIVGTVEIPDWENAVTTITNAKLKFDHFCEESKALEQQCHSWHSKLDSRVRDTRDHVSHIQYFKNQEENRKKRGWFDIVGHVSKFLFGTMDATDEEYIKKDLNMLNSQKSDTMNFMNKQVSILTENFNLLTGPLNELKENQKNVTKFLKSIIPDLQNMGDKIKINRLLIDSNLQFEVIIVWTM